LAISVFTSCMNSTKITGTWKKQLQTEKTYNSVFVASLTSNNIVRATVENDIATEFIKQGITAYKSLDEFPPGIKMDSISKENIMNRMKNKKAEAILTVSLIRKETESRYISNGAYPYSPFPRYAYYADFWGYYSYWYPSAYSPGYYEQDKTYFIETNLYDAVTEQLIWSAQSKTYNPAGIDKFSKEFSKLIVLKLKEDKMLKPALNPLSNK